MRGLQQDVRITLVSGRITDITFSNNIKASASSASVSTKNDDQDALCMREIVSAL